MQRSHERVEAHPEGEYNLVAADDDAERLGEQVWAKWSGA